LKLPNLNNLHEEIRVSLRSKLSPIVILTALFVLALIFTNAFTGVTQNQPQKSPDKSEPKKLIEAIRRGGYREAAKLKGHYVGTEDPNWDWANFNLEELTKRSAAVIVGVPQTSIAQLSPTGDQITTNYTVKVEKVIKGNLAANKVVEVSLLGGRVEFEDGTSAEIQTPDFERMQNGKRYILFLYANRNGSEIFLLTGGPQGLFELASDGKVRPHARPTEHVAKEIENKSIDSLLGSFACMLSAGLNLQAVAIKVSQLTTLKAAKTSAFLGLSSDLSRRHRFVNEPRDSDG
jgi:hypothetical protein